MAAFLGAVVLAAVVGFLRASDSPAAPLATTCTLVPQLRDVTVNQGLGTYSPLVNGKETLVRFYLSKPSCAGTGASIQVTGGSLTVKNGTATLGTVQAPTPAPISPAFPEIATYSVAPVADSTGDPKFVVPGSVVTQSGAFTASFSVTLSYQQRASKSASYASGSVTFSTKPGTTSPISASFAPPSNALTVLFVPMGDGSKTYSTQWTAAGQQAVQDGMTAAVSREYPLAAGIGSLGATSGGLRYAVAPTLIDLKGLGLLDSGMFCGTGASYDTIKAQLAQFRLSYNTANPTAQANRVVGVVDPSIAMLPPSPCFEAMAALNSQEAWAVAEQGRAGQLVGLELAHTLGLVPPDRESPFDGAHSQNVTAENPSLNRRFNIVQRSFIPTDRSLMKPSATNPVPDNINTLFEVPDFAFALCVLGGPIFTECQQYGLPGSVNQNPVGSTLAFVMSGSTDGSAGICGTCTGVASGTDVTESYYASSVPLTTPSSTSTYRLVQRSSSGAIVSNVGVPVGFTDSEHKATQSGTAAHQSGLFSFALAVGASTTRIELWKGSPGASGSLLLYAQNPSAAPQITDLTVGGGVIPFMHARRAMPARTHAPAITQAVETLGAQTDAPTTPTTITPSTSLTTAVSFGNTFSSVTSACVNWYFIGDLFDPGETVGVTLGNNGGGGASNVVGGSRRTQQLCMNTADKDQFLDGVEPLKFTVSGGDVTIGAVVVTVTGDSTAPVGYRISSDGPSYTVSQGSSVAIRTTVTDAADTTPPNVDLTSQALVPSGSFSTSPTSGTPTFASDGTFTASASTPVDTYYVVVTAKGGGFNRSYAVPVSVTSSGGGGGGAQPGPTYTVNTGSDAPADAGCTTSDCTLREAIDAANADGVDSTIQFAIDGSTEISLTSPLPAITDRVAILGATQPSGRISINGAGLSGSASGLVLGSGSDGSEIDKLAVNHFAGGTGIEVLSGSNTVTGNLVSDVGTGIDVQGGSAADNVIGGYVSNGEGNTIWSYSVDGVRLSGAGTGNRVSGNTVGLDAAGGAAGGLNGIEVASTPQAVIGALTIAGESNPPHVPGPGDLYNLDYRLGNVVDANSGVGIHVTGAPSSGNVVAGNYIGTNRSSATGLGNESNGLDVSASNNQLGPGNTIAYNGGEGIGSGVNVTFGSGNRIVANDIHDNGYLGITLAQGGNDLLAAPSLGSAQLSNGSTTVAFSVGGNNVSDGTYFVEFFKNAVCDPSGSGEGESFVDFTTVTVSGGGGSFSKSLGGLAVGDVVTATLTGSSARTNDTSEFSNCATVTEAPELPPGQEAWSATASDDHPADLRLDGFLVCPNQPAQVIFVGRRPDSSSPTTASWSGTIDTSLAPPNCTVKVAAADGVNRTPITDAGVAQTTQGDNPFVAAISSPRETATILQYGLIPLRGSIFSAQGVLPSSAHQWSLAGPSGLTRSGSGPIVDLQPPSGGWPAGSYTATLTTAGGGSSGTDTVHFTVVTDADNDGIPASVESQSCFGTGGDSDPLNAYSDQDNDGIPNVSDPAPCTPASSYTALVDVNPDPLPTGSSGSPVTAYVRIPGRDVAQVLGSSVRITRIADSDVSSNNNFKNTAWTVSNGVGTAKFDRQKVVQYLASKNIHNRIVSITVSGSSAGSSSWSFSGSDSVFVQG